MTDAELAAFVEYLERRYQIQVRRLVVYGRDDQGRMVRFALPEVER